MDNDSKFAMIGLDQCRPVGEVARVKVVSITDVRQDATNLIRHAQKADEPVLVVKHSKPAAYLVGADQYEALLEEVRKLRRAALVRDVATAEEEVRHGNLPAYDSVDELMAILEPDMGTPRRKRKPHGGLIRKKTAKTGPKLRLPKAR